MSNKTDYSLQRKQIRYIELKESDRLKEKDIIFENARVSCIGEDEWVGLRGKVINGKAAAWEFARKLNALIKNNLHLRGGVI